MNNNGGSSSSSSSNGSGFSFELVPINRNPNPTSMMTMASGNGGGGGSGGGGGGGILGGQFTGSHVNPPASYSYSNCTILNTSYGFRQPGRYDLHFSSSDPPHQPQNGFGIVGSGVNSAGTASGRGRGGRGVRGARGGRGSGGTARGTGTGATAPPPYEVTHPMGDYGLARNPLRYTGELPPALRGVEGPIDYLTIPIQAPTSLNEVLDLTQNLSLN